MTLIKFANLTKSEGLQFLSFFAIQNFADSSLINMNQGYSQVVTEFRTSQLRAPLTSFKHLHCVGGVSRNVLSIKASALKTASPGTIQISQ